MNIYLETGFMAFIKMSSGRKIGVKLISFNYYSDLSGSSSFSPF